MTEDQGKEPSIEALLNRLISEASRQEADSFMMPEANDVIAYLYKKASPAQEKAVREALLASATFRQEFLEFAKDLERLSDRETQKKIRESPVEKIPDLSAKVRSTSSVKEMPSKDTLWNRFKIILMPPRFAPATIAATFILAVIIFSVFWFSRATDTSISWHHLLLASLELADESVEPYLLSQNIPRSGTIPAIEVNDNFADSMAIAALKELVELDQETYLYRVIQNPSLPVASSLDQLVFLQLADSADQTIKEFKIPIPKTIHFDSAQVTTWILAFPGGSQYRLYRLDVLSDSVRTKWAWSYGETGAVVLTYAADSKYHRVRGGTFLNDRKNSLSP